MRKIKKNFENPIDNILIDIAEYLCHYFNKFNTTPNDLTTISLITGILSVFYLFNDLYIVSIIYLFISYFFDIMDGNYARKYKMETDFGDMYDHIKDIIINIFIIGLIIYKTYKIDLKLMKKYILIIIIINFLMNFHLGCQEQLYDNKQNNNFLHFNRVLCWDKKYINFSKFFGCGTYYLIIIILIYNLKNYL